MRTSASHRSLRNALPRPRPAYAPGTRPATSCHSDGAITRRLGHANRAGVPYTVHSLYYMPLRRVTCLPGRDT